MAKILAVLLLGLMLTGAVTATVYALPNLDQDRIADETQTESRLQQRNCDREMMQKQYRLQMRECNQNCNCTCNGPNCRASSELEVQGMYQNCVCEQTYNHAQNRNRYSFGIEKE